MADRPHASWSRSLVFLFVPFLVATLAACGGAPKPTYFPGYPIGFVERGEASWYGPGFHGNKTANGERYDMHQLTAAHRTLPLGSIAVVRSMSTGRQVTVRINDRGPFARGRVLDLSLAGAHALGMTGAGTDQIELRVVGYQGRADMGVLRVQVGSFSDQQNATQPLGACETSLLRRQSPGCRSARRKAISSSDWSVFKGSPGRSCRLPPRIVPWAPGLCISRRHIIR